MHLSTEITALGATVSQLGDVVQCKETEIATHESTGIASADQILQLQTLNTSLQQDTERYQEEVSRLQSELDCAQRLLQTKMAEISELTTTSSMVSSLQQQLEATNTEKFHVIKELTQARDQVAQYKQNILSNEEDKSELKKMKAEFLLKESRINEANRKIFSLEASLTGLNDLVAAKNQLQDKYNSVLVEQELLLGHTNKKQKFKFIQDLKTQIQELAEENNRLRSMKK